MKPFVIPVNPFGGDRKNIRSSSTGMRETIKHLSEGGCVGIFPAGEVSNKNNKDNELRDKEWETTAMKLIKKAKVPVVPMYFHAKNSNLFYNAAKIHPDLQTLMLPTEMMRARKTPSNQCHVTNLRDLPVQIAADAAEAALRGFAEQETTVAVARYAPFNAISLLIGAQAGRPGILTQCAVEEATELLLGMRGLTSYAETVSVYGTEPVFIDGDDTPWSKTFLASAYASRGLKMRYTSGSGSEVLMGYAEGCSMLYLECRCLFITKGAGVQGIQNGSVSCIGVPGAVPGGIREVIGENLVAMLLDLECASSNDQTFTHSDLRRSVRTLMQFAPGTDFINSGYSPPSISYLSISRYIVFLLIFSIGILNVYGALS